MMGDQDQSSLFEGGASPAAAISGVGLLVIASGRIVSALICTMALLWINSLTVFIAGTLRKFFPLSGGKSGVSGTPFPGIVFAFLASWTGLLFFFILWLSNPFMAMESAFFIALCPAFLSFSDFSAKLDDSDTMDLVLQAVSAALVLGVLVLGAALIREPLGSGTFSFPGFELTRWTEINPLSILQTSAGALILLGYLFALYRRFRGRRFGGAGREQ